MFFLPTSLARHKYATWLLLALALAYTQPAFAQQKSAPPPAAGPLQLQPLYGGITPAQAAQVVGPAVLADVDRSFASRTEASQFFSQKGFEYLVENQPDTATVRFNLAWALNPQNPDPYRGLAVLLSQRDNTPPEVVERLLLQGLAVAPTNAPLLTDAATTTLSRYEKTKKKKDLTQARDYVQRALLADTASSAAWQTAAHVRYLQEDYAGAWQAIHKARNLNFAGLDFDLISQLVAKMPDPEGKIK